MPIRIYALAKKLGIENKELVDICTKAGIKGKGSALASLDDDEVVKVEAFLKGGDAGGRAAAEPAPVAPAKPKPKPAPAPVAASQKRTEPEVLKRPESPVSRKVGPIRDLSARAKRKKESGDESSPAKKEPGKKDAPVIRMAVMPEVSQPPASKKTNEPKVQKPDIALPQDTIRKVRERSPAPLNKFTDSTKSRTKKKGKGTDLTNEQLARELNQLIPGNKPAATPSRGQKGKRGDGKTGTDAGMGNTREARTRNRKRSSRPGEDDSSFTPRRRHARRRSGVNTAAPRKEAVSLALPCTVRTFSEAAGVPAGRVLREMMEMGTMATINAQIDEETAQILADQLGAEIEFKLPQTLEESLITAIDETEDEPDQLSSRPPVVTFLGHVDHGKTSLLDALMGIDVASGEAGGITQHIRAYIVDKDGRQIAFVDTPGHEAFTEMRARGANVTDIAVLVVAADDGVMPQTEEAISHARAAGVPIVVALNKMDLPGADENKAMQDLASRELLPSEWGGEIEVVKTSASTGMGLDELLETLLVTAELHEYTSNPDRPATGVCLEAEQEPGRGVIAKVIVKNGSLNVGDVVVCGTAFGRVKAMYDTLRPRRTLDSAGPSVPVNLTGLDTPPNAGDQFYVLDEIADAREIAQRRLNSSREEVLAPITKRVSLEDFQQRLESGNLDSDHDVSTLNLIIRADTQGSIEAIKKELGKLDHPEVQIKILQATVGGVTPADVTLASASDAVILAFNVVPDDAARSVADDKRVEIRRYEVIYKLTEDIKSTLEGKLKPMEETVEQGTAMVLKTFTISRTGTVAGCRVMRGTIDRNSRIRVIRDSRVIGDYPIETLKREKDDAKEVRQGMECGIKLSGFNDVKEADSFEAYRIQEVARTL